MRTVAPDAVLVAKPNAGIPEIVDARAVYRATPEVMSGYAVSFRDAGATIVGACCGSMPSHLAAMSAALAAGQNAGQHTGPEAGQPGGTNGA
jgi:5-methyltetrahydrofolate--homocysteine methyltransferase